MWARERRARARARRSSFTIEVPTARAAARARARLRRRAAGARRASACSSSTTTPPTGACSALQTAKWGMAVARHRVAGTRRCAGSTRARPSTSRSSTCTCRRWTALALARRDPRAPRRRCRWCCSARSAGARPATPTALFSAYLAKPIRQSQLFDTLVGLLAHDAAPKAAPAPAKPQLDPGDGGAPSAAHPARRGQRRQPEARAAPAAADGLPRRPRVERHRGGRVGGAPDLRRGADGRADAGDGRPRGVAADQPRSWPPASGRASSR